jgi:hypothetical protein
MEFCQALIPSTSVGTNLSSHVRQKITAQEQLLAYRDRRVKIIDYLLGCLINQCCSLGSNFFSLDPRPRIATRFFAIRTWQFDVYISAVSQSRPNNLAVSTLRFALVSYWNSINFIAFHLKYSSIASGFDDRMIKIWDRELGELLS